MIQCINTAMLHGIDALAVKVECDVSDGLPGFEMVGYLSSEVKEAGYRVKSALKNAGYKLPAKKIMINFSPASIRKSGTGFDLPVLVGVAAAYGFVNAEHIQSTLIVGEVSLTGRILPINGILPIVSAARKNGMEYCIVPKENEREAGLEQEIKIIGVQSIEELFGIIRTKEEMDRKSQREVGRVSETYTRKESEDDFAQICGNEFGKRAILVAVSGMHNLLFIGTPGSGKTMLASRIPTIMPDMNEEEILEVTKIYSVCGLMGEKQTYISKRPFRNPHHSATAVGLVGGGMFARPGEISLAHKGVLFLDELPEFQVKTIETLRQPLEEGKVTITRLSGTYTYPSRFMLVGAMNPCPCGYYPDYSKCNCTETAIRKYLGKISGPLMDRMDLCVEVSEVKYEELRNKNQGMSSAQMKQIVERVHMVQQKRFREENISFNSEMTGGQIEKYCYLTGELEHWMEGVYKKKKMSVRSYHKLLKVARTIADLNGHEQIQKSDLEEALLYKNPDEKYWGK